MASPASSQHKHDEKQVEYASNLEAGGYDETRDKKLM